jgi:hypothetical protein
MNHDLLSFSVSNYLLWPYTKASDYHLTNRIVLALKFSPDRISLISPQALPPLVVEPFTPKPAALFSEELFYSAPTYLTERTNLKLSG